MTVTQKKTGKQWPKFYDLKIAVKMKALGHVSVDEFSFLI